jgi:PAS domain S-box-containing protein
VDELMTSEGSVALEKRFIGPDGREIWASDHLSVTRDADGTPVSIVAVARDITERLKITSQLAASERKFRAITDAMPQMVWSTLPDGFHDYYNQRWYEFTGAPEGTTDGEGWNNMFHPDDQTRAWERWRHCLETGDAYDIEYRLRHHSGDYRWVLGRALPIYNAAGQIERWFGTCTDIEDIKRSEEARELLAQELSHRIKNIFAVVGGLVSLTSRGNPQHQAFATGFRDRLNALSLANEYVRPHADTVGLTDGQTVQGLLRTLLKPYLDHEGGRFVFLGSDAAVGPKTATALALVMHEQATNAMKYGALSNATGRVYITGESENGCYELTWREDGGPVVAGAPGRRGFGTDMAARSAAGQLGGRIEHRWEPSGLVMVLTVPEENLMR